MKISIDGPAAAGKSTVARLVAEKLGFTYIDTGAMYRAVTLLSLRHKVVHSDSSSLSALIDTHQFEFNGTQTVINGSDVSSEIRSDDVTGLVSYVCAHKEVRDKLVSLQRIMAEKGSVVMDGRDIGTVVLPDADLKVFITASPLERAKRRKFDPKNPELREVSLEDIARDIEKRDKLDSERPVAPLKPAVDAIIIDTTGHTIDDSVNMILNLVYKITDNKQNLKPTRSC